LNEGLTDVLVRRGGMDVHRVLAQNSGAHFSDEGYSALVVSAERDEGIAQSLGLRVDLPLRLLRELLSKATKAVREKLLSVASRELASKIEAVINSVATRIDTGAPSLVECTKAQSVVAELNRAGKLNDSAINRFAVCREHANILASLSLLSTVSIEAIQPLLEEPGCNGLVVACRAAKLTWSTTLAIINSRPGMEAVSAAEADQYQHAFETLTPSSAQRTIRFWSARTTAAKSA
jgi:uncharacterized protein (DUF2336 family)